MVTFQEIQTAYYMVAATGVLVAAIYYIMNLQAAERNKKIQLSMSITEKMGNQDFLRDWLTLMSTSWTDIDDFVKRYDSSANTEESKENWSQRWHHWSAYETYGYLLKNNLIDGELIYNSQGVHAMMMWIKYAPIFEYYRKKELGPRYFEYYEYLAKTMWDIGRTRGLTSPNLNGDMPLDINKNIFEPTTKT